MRKKNLLHFPRFEVCPKFQCVMFRTSTGPTTHSLYRSALNKFEILYAAECEINMSSCFQSPVCEDEWKSMESSVPVALFEQTNNQNKLILSLML